MALLGLGGRALRERLIRQYGILPPGSIGQTLFDEIIPVVMVDDLTRGLVIDQSYRAPAVAGIVQGAVSGENSFCGLTAPAGGSLVLVEKMSYRTGSAALCSLRVGATGTQSVNSSHWRDRRLPAGPTCVAVRGTRVGLVGSGMLDMRGIATEHLDVELNIILNPSDTVLQSTIAVWCHSTNIELDVNFFWREVILP